MASQSDLSLQGKNLFQQGFQSYTPAELKSLQWGLRFTPFICMCVGFYGLVTHNIAILFTVSAIGIIAAFFPKKHPFDLIYNHLIRHLFKGVALPPNPLQRRLACLGAGFMNAGISFLFLADPTVHPRTLAEIDLTMAGLGTGGVVAYIMGYSLIAMQLIVFSNHFCLLSWGYEKLMNAMGLTDRPVNAERAQKLIGLDALVIDVRDQEAFHQGHIENAVNIPLEELKDSNRLRSLQDRLALVYCSNGRYSFIAQELMRKHGISMAYAMGSYEQAKKSLKKP
jgi:rhodanese-related sulfurtransferase